MKFSLFILKDSYGTTAVGSGTGDQWVIELTFLQYLILGIDSLNNCKCIYHVIFQLKNFCPHHS